MSCRFSGCDDDLDVVGSCGKSFGVALEIRHNESALAGIFLQTVDFVEK